MKNCFTKDKSVSILILIYIFIKEFFFPRSLVSRLMLINSTKENKKDTLIFFYIRIVVFFLGEPHNWFLEMGKMSLKVLFQYTLRFWWNMIISWKISQNYGSRANIELCIILKIFLVFADLTLDTYSYIKKNQRISQ